MPGFEEDTYSIMFSSLKHPARRKILRMLSEKPMAFSEMLEELKIPGSHLTYHLENLHEFIVKMQDGKYNLSGTGESAVSIMRGAEEVPKIEAKKFSSLPPKWRSLLAFFIVASVLLASLSLVQFALFSQLSYDYESMKDEIEQTLPWSSAERAVAIIRDVVQIDTTRYHTTLISSTVENRSDLEGMVEEILKYSFQNERSNIDLTLRFRNNHFSLYQLSIVEGIPAFSMIYVKPQSADILQATRNLVERYRSISNEPYLEEMSRLLSSATETSDEQTLGNVKLRLTISGSLAEVLLMYNSNEFGFSAKSLRFVFQDHVLREMSDDWFLYKVSDAGIDVSQEQAVQIARSAAMDFEWTTNGVTVSNFTVLAEPVSVVFFPHPRTELLTLVPYWYVTLHLDKEYPVGVKVISVGVWADTGNVANIQPLSG